MDVDDKIKIEENEDELDFDDGCLLFFVWLQVNMFGDDFLIFFDLIVYEIFFV